MAAPTGTSNGRFSRRLAIAIYSAFLEEFGAIIEKLKEEQYADSIEGTLQGKEFKFRIHHDKDGEFSKIDWQKVSRADFQEIKGIFDAIKGDITRLSTKAAKVQCRWWKLRIPASDHGNLRTLATFSRSP